MAGASKRSKKIFSWRTTISIFLPLAVVAVWLGMAGVGGPYFGKIEEVSSNDPATFLPSSAESTKVNELLKDYRESSTIPVITIFESVDSLTGDELKEIEAIKDKVAQSDAIAGVVSPLFPSDDKKAALFLAPIDSEAEFDEVVPEITGIVKEAEPSVDYGFTGPALFSRDLQAAFAGIDGTLLLVALSVVFVILLIVYRSPLLPIITLTGALSALAAAILAVFYLAKADIVMLNGQVQGILFILVIGAAADYSLLYIARYREELTRHTDRWAATKVAWRSSVEPIVAAGGTVMLGLMCLLASDLASNQALGPVGSIGILFSILVALTFLPAALLMAGKAAFWPRPPKEIAVASSNDDRVTHQAWQKVANLVSKHPRRIWMGTLALLLIACAFVPQLRAEGVSQENLIIGQSDARDGQAMLNRHFASGSGSPAYVIVPEDDIDAVVDLIEEDDGVVSVALTSDSEAMPSLPVGQQAEELGEIMGPGGMVIDPFAGIGPKIVDGKAMLEVTLTDDASSVSARQTIERLRNRIQPKHNVMFGGVSAIQLDTNDASDRDLAVVIPLILAAISIVLMLLLRSIVAPLVLLFTTVVSFGATLGVSALLFNNIWQFPGADPAVIIFGFVFLVALGIDYNIFLMTRVREETIKHGVREGTLRALVVTGGVITSAGIVLAATFAALNVIPILFLAQISFIVAFGVLLDTLIVRSLLVPAFTLEVGRLMWWPSKLAKRSKR